MNREDSEFVWVDELSQFKPKLWVASGGLAKLKADTNKKKLTIEDTVEDESGWV